MVDAVPANGMEPLLSPYTVLRLSHVLLLREDHVHGGLRALSRRSHHRHRHLLSLQVGLSHSASPSAPSPLFSANTC